MKLIAGLIAALFGFVLGAAIAVFLVGLYVDATHACPPGATEPCDIGGWVGMGLVIVWAPILGLACASLGYWLAVRRQRRNAA